MLKNRRLTIRDLADEVGISKGSANTILKDVLGPKTSTGTENIEFFGKKASRWSVWNDAFRLPGCHEMHYNWRWDLICAYDPETTDHSREYRAKREPRPKKSRQIRSKIKVMLPVFFDYLGVVHYEFLPTGQKVNKEYYLNVMRRLRNAIRLKTPELWKDHPILPS